MKGRVVGPGNRVSTEECAGCALHKSTQLGVGWRVSEN